MKKKTKLDEELRGVGEVLALVTNSLLPTRLSGQHQSREDFAIVAIRYEMLIRKSSS